MREQRVLVAAALGALLLTGACGAASPSSSVHVTELATARAGSLSLTGGWMLAPPRGDMSGMDMSQIPHMRMDAPAVAAYGVFHNGGRTADALTAVVAPRGAVTRLHVIVKRATSETMKDVSGLDLPAGGRATLTPGGSHVMVTGLKPVPAPGHKVKLTFVFRSGTRLTTQLPVISALDRPGASGG